MLLAGGLLIMADSARAFLKAPTQVAPTGQQNEPPGHSVGPASVLVFYNEPSVEPPDYQPF
jgi:reactive chlorine resistance protein C